ncbi:hypothetical protein HAX54_032972, partial [Datura stramonium]|nr:hypothetical protein [Datura stramonium]
MVAFRLPYRSGEKRVWGERSDCRWIMVRGKKRGRERRRYFAGGPPELVVRQDEEKRKTKRR